MKRTLQKTVSVLLILILALGLTACGKSAPEGLWKNATYTKDASFGSGAKTLTAVVEMEEKSVTFTVKTDAETVGAALLEHGLITGEESEYGLYVKTVNGVLADYDADQSYWAFYEGETYAMQGVDQTPIVEGTTYRLVYSK